MKNFLQPGGILSVPVNSEVLSGELVVIGSLIGVSLTDGKKGDVVSLCTQGVFELLKVEADEVSLGSPLSFLEGKLTTKKGEWIAVAIESSLAGTKTVKAKLK